MRNFNSHLTDDSSTTGLGKTVKTLTKMVDAGKSLLGFDTDSQESVELAQPSIVRQAQGMLNGDVLTEFYRSADREEAPSAQETDKVSGAGEFNLPEYAVKNYMVRIASQNFGTSSAQFSVSGSLMHGRISMFNALNYMIDYTAQSGGTLHFRDSQFGKEGADGPLKKLAENPTVKNLVENPVGSSAYTYEDFMFCSELGRLSNNHMITLRKFPAPVNDNIFLGTESSDTEGNRVEIVPDVGRMICYFGGEDNQLEDILNYTYFASWRDFKGEYQDVDTGTDNESSGMLGVLSNIISPSYSKGVNIGYNSGRGLGRLLGAKWQNKMAAQQRKVMFEHYDKHKIYEPKNIIRDTKYYEGVMNFSNSFTLTFKYKMRSFGDINQKMAFLDLLGNILNVTYRKATFWGGDVNWIGTPQDRRPFNIANALVDKAFDKVGGIWNELFSQDGKLAGMLANFDWSNFTLANVGKAVIGMIEEGTEMVKEAGEKLVNGASKVKEKSEKAIQEKGPKFVSFIQNVGNNLGNIAKGAVKNRLGRPQVYALNSLLTSAPTGVWHVTVGNPFNPIATMGNMVIDKVTLIQGGALNIDDFPEEITVKITLVHGKPRDITGISHMYTKGYGEIFSAINRHGVSAASKKTGKKKRVRTKKSNKK